MPTQKSLRKSTTAVALAGISTLAVMVSGTAMAQQSANVATEEIIVTAQRRAERLQDVPVAISTATAAQLERAGITNMRDLSAMAPGLISTSGAGANLIPTIRGVSSSQTDPGNDANVSLYIDGVYQPDQLINSAGLADIERVEVLKGPQGTLFGRNATGGAIRIWTKSPDLEYANGSVDFSYGRYNETNANVFLSVPLVAGKLAASVSVHYMRIDGYHTNISTNRRTDVSEDQLVRLKLLAQPTDNLKIEAFGMYLFHVDSDATAYTALRGNATARLFGSLIADQPYTYSSEWPVRLKALTYQTGIKFTLDTDVGEFSSLSAYNSVRSFYTNEADFGDTDLLSYPIWKTQNNFQQELLYNSKKFGDFQLTAGASYYGDTARYDPLILQGTFIGFAFGDTDVYGYMKQRTEAFGIFGEGAWTPTDRLTVTAGVRYSSEKRSAYWNAAVFGYAPNPGRPATLSPLGVPTTFNSTTPRASIRYRLTDEGDNVYFTYSHGFKSGGFNMSGLQPVPYKPEKLISYEVGLKTAPSRMISANIAAFYYDYTNQQVMTILNNLNLTTNAASSRMYGADADITARLTDEFTVTVGLSFLDGKYRDFPGAIGHAYTVLVPGEECLCGKASVTIDNLAGGRTPFSPKFTASVTATYVKEFSAGTLELSGTLYHSDSYNYEIDGLIKQDGYETLALRSSFTPANSNFTFFAYGRNVTSTKYFANTFLPDTGDGVRYARPATYGGGVKYNF